MGILSKKNTPDKWKDKYFNLLDENEDLESSNQEREDLLCKTIIRLSFATMGANKELDPYLKKIRTQLKKGLKTEQLKSELGSFSDALITMEESEPRKNLQETSLLFDFLVQHFSDQENSLRLLQDKFNTKFTNQTDLFFDINHLIRPSKQEVASSIPKLNKVETKSVLSHLLLLLDTTEIPAQLDTQAQSLKEKIHNEAPISIVLEETISLLFQIKKHIQSEQKGIAEFLAQLTEQLAEIGIKAAGAQSSSKSTTEKRNLLDQSVSLHVLELQESSKNATQLEPLKQLIHSRVEAINQLIQDHQVQEKNERNKVEKIENLLESLTTKLRIMEKESQALKDKLDTAHEKAVHDPLTSLPNRLAYDDRLKVELARWKRYKTPLSLLIWDIDSFKKINDTYGHKAGDKTLILISKLLASHCRETDFVSRFGGEEFTMLLPNTDGQSALLAANKIRKIIEKTAFNSNGKKIPITISCGITQFTNDDTEGSAFNRADKALYEAKNRGRNQCILDYENKSIL